jgi:uncharacterized RDD family membrane protein YckC
MKSYRLRHQLIQTPEGIVFSFPLASVMSRFLAWLIDFGCISAIASGLGLLTAVLRIISVDVAQAVMVLGYFMISIGYGIILEWFWRGQTVGKRLLGLRVVDEQGLKLQFSQVLIRNLLRFVDMLPLFYVVGGLTSLLSTRAQRLGDWAATTIVVRARPLGAPDLDQILGDKYNSLRSQALLAARLRQQVSAPEAALAVRAMLRRNSLEAQARVELFAAYAEHFRALVKFPEEVTDGMTDEQFVRNVVDLVFRPQLKSR